MARLKRLAGGMEIAYPAACLQLAAQALGSPFDKVRANWLARNRIARTRLSILLRAWCDIFDVAGGSAHARRRAQVTASACCRQSGVGPKQYAECVLALQSMLELAPRVRFCMHFAVAQRGRGRCRRRRCGLAPCRCSTPQRECCKRACDGSEKTISVAQVPGVAVGCAAAAHRHGAARVPLHRAPCGRPRQPQGQGSHSIASTGMMIVIACRLCCGRRSCRHMRRAGPRSSPICGP